MARPAPRTDAAEGFADPSRDCPACPRLCQYRAENRKTFPDKHNAPVPAFGGLDAPFLIVGLAPGLRGANFTGRPFTGDYAGDLLYATLPKFGFAQGPYAEHAGDGLSLIDCRITNAVRCVPPENKPLPAEMKNCLPFLEREMAAMKNLRVVLALGLIAHNAVLKACGARATRYKFAHNARHTLDSGLILADSYHCSRYNTNTGRLTPAMFETVFAGIAGILRG